jgi:hypothetical protein
MLPLRPSDKGDVAVRRSEWLETGASELMMKCIIWKYNATASEAEGGGGILIKLNQKRGSRSSMQ